MVLEAGCGDGEFGLELALAGNAVTGVDSDPHRWEELLQPPVETFDRILLLDVLEHLPDPSPLLRDARRLLAQRGKLIVAVPNAVNVTVRLLVLAGRFRYSDRGILDWSHLRFFTRKTIRELLVQHGYRIRERRYTVIPLERVIPFSAENRLMRLANRVLRLATAAAPGLLAYEIILVAER